MCGSTCRWLCGRALCVVLCVCDCMSGSVCQCVCFSVSIRGCVWVSECLGEPRCLRVCMCVRPSEYVCVGGCVCSSLIAVRVAVCGWL